MCICNKIYSLHSIAESICVNLSKNLYNRPYLQQSSSTTKPGCVADDLFRIETRVNHPRNQGAGFSYFSLRREPKVTCARAVEFGYFWSFKVTDINEDELKLIKTPNGQGMEILKITDAVTCQQLSEELPSSDFLKAIQQGHRPSLSSHPLWHPWASALSKPVSVN